jgi:hypothetical protein
MVMSAAVGCRRSAGRLGIVERPDNTLNWGRCPSDVRANSGVCEDGPPH